MSTEEVWHNNGRKNAMQQRSIGTKAEIKVSLFELGKTHFQVTESRVWRRRDKLRVRMWAALAYKNHVHNAINYIGIILHSNELRAIRSWPIRGVGGRSRVRKLTSERFFKFSSVKKKLRTIFRRKEKKIKSCGRSLSCKDLPARGTVCMSDFEGCGAVEYIYLKSWSTWLLAMPPPRSEIFKEMSSLPLTIVTLIGGMLPLSWCVSITARIEFLNNSNKMWYRCDGT